jgi:hypothetical protein
MRLTLYNYCLHEVIIQLMPSYEVNIIQLLPSYEVNIESCQSEAGCFTRRFGAKENNFSIVDNLMFTVLIFQNYSEKGMLKTSQYI